MKWMLLRTLILGLMSAQLSVASKTPDQVSLGSFYETNESPEDPDTNNNRPELRTATIVVDVMPLQRVFDTAETTLFSESMVFFYQQIFESQQDFNLVVRDVKVDVQLMDRKTRMLSLETVIAANFLPSSLEQELTDHDFHQVCYHLVNSFSAELTKYLKDERHSLAAIETISARTTPLQTPPETMEDEKPDSNGMASFWAYILIAVGSCVMTGAVYASYRLYRQEFRDTKFGRQNLGDWNLDFDAIKRPFVQGPPKSIVMPSRRNLSPFRDGNYDNDDGVRTPDRSVLVVEDDNDEAVEASARFSFRPSEIDPDSPQPSYPETLSQDTPSFTDKLKLTMDDSILQTDAERAAIRTELWAPAGKLGVAIDVVDGQPVVYRIKEGSPLEGFLAKGDKIVAIDETDTTRMTAADVTALMVRRMTKRRKIIYIRGDAQ